MTPELDFVIMGKSPRGAIEEMADFREISARLAGRRVEIRRTGCDPFHELGHFHAGQKGMAFTADPAELGIGEMGMDRAMADRVNRHRIPPALGFGHCVVPLHLAAQRASAEPADSECLRFCHLTFPLRCSPSIAQLAAKENRADHGV